jgi:LPXTG-motif cell wall-anchored protein
VVASVQTAPTTTAGSAATTGSTNVAGIANLPSTNTGDSTGLLGLGAALMALGAFLVRLPTKSRK